MSTESLTTAEKRRWLEQVPSFRGASADVLDQLADTSGETAFAAGSRSSSRARSATGFSIVVAGIARIVRGDTEPAGRLRRTDEQAVRLRH
jgi:hypothetical protein